MKKIIYLSAVISIGFMSCSKENGSSDLPQPTQSDEITVPSSFGRKVLIEEFTGAWCGYCPRGTFFFDSVNTIYPGKLVGVAIHVNNGGTEVMEDPQLLDMSNNNIMADFYQITGEPSGMINRGVIDDPVDWPSELPSQLGLFAKCGFKIDASSISGHTLTLTVHTGFASDLSGDYRLNTWIVERDVHSATNTDYDQHNYYCATCSSPEPTYPYYTMADIMNDFHHENVLRKMITSVPHGDQIPNASMAKGKDYVKTFTVDLTGINYSNCDIVVFLDKYSTVPTTDAMHPQHQIQNVQKVRIGSSIDWN